MKHRMCGPQVCWQYGAHSRVVRSLLATWNSHSRLHGIGDEEYAVSVTAASYTEQVRRVVFTLLATWSTTRRVVYVAGSMELKMTTLGGCSTGWMILSAGGCAALWCYSIECA